MELFCGAGVQGLLSTEARSRTLRNTLYHCWQPACGRTEICDELKETNTLSSVPLLTRLTHPYTLTASQYGRSK